MEVEQDDVPKSSMQIVLDSPELRMQILSFLELPKGLSIRVVSN
jgi:hypothetical protein